MTGHSGSVDSVAFSLDGKQIVSGGSDKTVRVWDAASLQPVGNPMTGHSGPISSVSFVDDDRTIVSEEFSSTENGGFTRTWPGPRDWADSLCEKLTANMTHEQWRDWVSPDVDYVQTCSHLPPASD